MAGKAYHPRDNHLTSVSTFENSMNYNELKYLIKSSLGEGGP